jgi:hypothetical protein
MLDRTEMSEEFGKYIPKFEYELVSMRDYGEKDLTQFGDALSLFMLFDKLDRPEDLRALRDLPDDYAENLKRNMPPHLHKLLADTAATLLRRINVPEEEIDRIADRIYKRRFHEMFRGMKGYDVQETRRIAREEGIREGILEGKREGVLEGVLKGERAKSIEIARKMKRENMIFAHIAALTGLSEDEIKLM